MRNIIQVDINISFIRLKSDAEDGICLLSCLETVALAQKSVGSTITFCRDTLIVKRIDLEVYLRFKNRNEKAAVYKDVLELNQPRGFLSAISLYLIR